jgi:ATP-binding cassette, subfamily B, bacterial
MKLKYELPEEFYPQLGMSNNESIHYLAPYDLGLELSYVSSGYVIVTNLRIIVIDGFVTLHNISLIDCERIRCESMVNNGVLSVTINGIDIFLARFSMKHVSRFAYIARGAELLKKGDNTPVESKEREYVCEKCGRALPGTSICPHCDGHMITFRKFWDLCKTYRIRLFSISLFMILSSFISLMMPEIQKNFIDQVLTNKTGNTSDILKFIITMLSLTALIIVINICRNWWCVSLGARISMDLRALLYQKLQILSLSFLNMRKPGDLMNRIVSDTTEIRRFMEDAFSNMFSTLFTMCGAFIFMILLDWKLTILSTIFIGVVAFISWAFRKRIHRMFHHQWTKHDKLKSSLQDVISGIRVVKSFGKENAEAEHFSQLTKDFSKTQKNLEVFWAIFSPMLTFIMGIGIYFATYFGGLNVLHGNMTTGELIQFITYTSILYGPLNWMTHLPRRIIQMVTALERIYDVLDEQPDIVDNMNAKDRSIDGNITFNHVHFGYKSYEPVLKDINFHVNKGEMIGLVGSSGTGKSTLINLIMRLYDVNQGEILIDGVNINQIKTTSLHSQIGVVLQETFLFSGTILNNIRFSKPDATIEEIILAAKTANAHDFICKMPDGYNTYVGEHGYNLSGGERQRIAIARAILNNPRLLILDEATSALDTESEYLIQQALDRLTEGRTTFAIAHRLSTLRNADRLIVIDGHHIAEIGTHNELLEKKGIYHKLVTAQLEMQKIDKTDKSIAS